MNELIRFERQAIVCGRLPISAEAKREALQLARAGEVIFIGQIIARGRPFAFLRANHADLRAACRQIRQFLVETTGRAVRVEASETVRLGSVDDLGTRSHTRFTYAIRHCSQFISTLFWRSAPRRALLSGPVYDEIVIVPLVLDADAGVAVEVDAMPLMVSLALRPVVPHNA